MLSATLRVACCGLWVPCHRQCIPAPTVDACQDVTVRAGRSMGGCHLTVAPSPWAALMMDRLPKPSKRPLTLHLLPVTLQHFKTHGYLISSISCTLQVNALAITLLREIALARSLQTSLIRSRRCMTLRNYLSAPGLVLHWRTPAIRPGNSSCEFAQNSETGQTQVHPLCQGPYQTQSRCCMAEQRSKCQAQHAHYAQLPVEALAVLHGVSFREYAPAQLAVHLLAICWA